METLSVFLSAINKQHTREIRDKLRWKIENLLRWPVPDDLQQEPNKRLSNAFYLGCPQRQELQT